MYYDIVLIKKPYIEGITREETSSLWELLEDDIEVLPIEIEDGEAACSVMGFITVDAASMLNYDYNNSGLKDFVIVAMNCGDNYFNFNGINIYLLK